MIGQRLQSAAIRNDTPANTVDTSKFNAKAVLPFELRLKDFEIALQDVYDFFFDVNHWLVEKGLTRLDDMLRPAITSGILSDMLTASLAKHPDRWSKTDTTTGIRT